MNAQESLGEVLTVGIPVVLGGGLALSLIVFVVFSVILWYHWTHYAVSEALVRKVTLVYTIMSGICIFSALVATAVYFMTL